MELPNLDYINRLSGDDVVFRQKLIDTIKAELPLEIAAYKTALEAKNYKGTAETVHKLKHKISVLGMEKSYYIAENFEDNLLKNSEMLKSEFEKVLNSIEIFTAGL